MKSKIQSSYRLSRLCKRLRKARKKIVFTNGTFDLLHAGHISYLEKAKTLGDVLIVGVNSDKSVKTYKGPSRPFVTEKDRLRVLSALECVDYVILFREPTPLKLITTLKPHVLVKGSDWAKSQIAGGREVLGWGGRVRRLPFLGGRSSSKIIERIQKAAARKKRK